MPGVEALSSSSSTLFGSPRSRNTYGCAPKVPFPTSIPAVSARLGGDFGVVHTVDIKSDDPDFVADILCVAVYRDAIDRKESVDRLSEQDLLVFLASSNRLRCHKQVFSKRSLLKKHR